jgi:acetolactate synthase-1/2/3 large subunit
MNSKNSNSIKVTDFIANALVHHGIRHIFMLTGGGAMHLNDSLGKHPALQVIFNHHEQASAMAAESYARLTNQMAVVNVTTGPGGINAFNGVFGAWTDSIPMLIISGQISYSTTVHSSGLHLRQLGDQECDVIRSVRPFTKYATMITDANEIKYHLQKALYIATHGRPGPVWLDIPINIQGSYIQAETLPEFNAKKKTTPINQVNTKIQQLIIKLQQAKRPVILAGNGIRIANAHQAFLSLIEQLKIPVTTAWNAHDLVSNDNKYYVGRPGSIGDRAGNFSVQNSDFLLILGSRLNIRQIGYNWKTFARAAFKVMVDIDALELIKPTLKIDLPIKCHLAYFIDRLQLSLKDITILERKDWLNWCKRRQKKYPVVLPEYWQLNFQINPYCFMHILSQELAENQITVTGNGTACVTAFQAMIIKKGQRLYTNSGCASMGYDLPAAIGACIGSGGKKIICITGDGSIQQNIQELATIAFNKYPIKIFVLNNNGYHSIRQTQKNFFGEKFVGCGIESGLGFPDCKKIAAAYEIIYRRCDTHHDLNNAITATLSSNAPSICEILLTQAQGFAPKLSSKKLANGKIISKPLEDLAPFLSNDELAKNMLIDLIPETETS